MSNDKQKTRESILNSAKKIFAKEGFHDTSMAAIAEDAGLGKGTLYWHFSGKQELFKEMIRREGESILLEIDKHKNENMLPSQMIREFIRFRLKRMNEFKDNALIFLDNENFINKDFMEEMLKIRRAVIDKLKDIVQEGIEQDIFQGESVEIIAISILGTINSVGLSLLLNDRNDINFDELVELAYNFILNGIGK